MGQGLRSLKTEGLGARHRERGTGHGAAKWPAMMGRALGSRTERSARWLLRTETECLLAPMLWAPQAYMPSSDGGSTWGGETTLGIAPLTFTSSNCSQARCWAAARRWLSQSPLHALERSLMVSSETITSKKIPWQFSKIYTKLLLYFVFY